jgi:bifunctional non-homologous end joining protein LigD
MSITQIGGHEIELKNLDKPFFPDADITKGNVVDYYRDIALTILPHLEDRPLTLQRFPDGIGEEGFYQQDRPDYFPDWIADVALERAGESGEGPVHHVLCNNVAALVYLANQGVITLHGWLSQADRPKHPDSLIFDLDPPDDDFDAVRYAARRVGELMEEIGLMPHVMTTGSRGLHVLAPLDAKADFDAVRGLGRAMAEHLADAHPDRLTLEQRKDKRKGRLYLDVMRNTYGHTAVVPYSLRAKPGAPVATPLDWDELERSDLGPRSYNLRNIRQRLFQKDDPWRTMRRHAASAERARERFEKLVGG